jgi:hypothetical protein
MYSSKAVDSFVCHSGLAPESSILVIPGFRFSGMTSMENFYEGTNLKGVLARIVPSQCSLPPLRETPIFCGIIQDNRRAVKKMRGP